MKDMSDKVDKCMLYFCLVYIDKDMSRMYIG